VSGSKSRVLAGLVAGLATLTAIGGIALAAKPKPHYTFETPSLSSPTVYFRTGASRRKLLMFSAGLAIKCNSSTCGGFGGISSFTRNSVKVTKHGAFKVTGSILGAGLPGHQKKLGTETITGKFVTSTEVKGKVTSDITLGTGPSGYHGVTKHYTATGTPTIA